MYSSVFDVRNALTPGAVSSDNSTASSLLDPQITDAIEQADAKINGYLPAGYTVGLTAIQQGDPAQQVTVATAPFRYWSRDIAAYLATLTFKRNKDVSNDDPVRLRYEAAMTDLLAVAKGQYILPPDPSTADDTEGSVVVYNQYEGQMFGPSDFDLKGIYAGSSGAGSGSDTTIIIDGGAL